MVRAGVHLWRINFGCIVNGMMIILLLFIVVPNVSFSQDYYVDFSVGIDQAGCGSISSPCKTPWSSNLRTQLKSGDTVTINEIPGGGVYYNSGGGVIEASTPNITWKAAAGKIVWLSSTNDHTSNPYSTRGPYSTVNISAPSVAIDGFYVWGSILVNFTGDNAIIRNCDLSGGGDYQGFPAVIRTTGTGTSGGAPPSDWCENLLVKNCKIHDNKPAFNQGPMNDMLVLTYTSKNVTIENCEFYNGLNMGIRWKDRANKMTARYNYFHDMPVGISGDGQYGVDWIDSHHNVFVNITGQAIAPESGAPNAFYIRNNTFYDCNEDIGYWNGPGLNQITYNNIFYHTASGQYYYNYGANWNIGSILYLNYNNYYSTSNTPWRINSYSTNAAVDLIGWQKYLASQGANSNNNESNSVSTNPLFLNASGRFNTPTDFKRSSYPLDGRGGAMGAYETGSESIGVGTGYNLPAPPPPPAPLKVPTPPSNVYIQ